MRRHLLVAGIAVVTLIPSFALAQQTCEQRRDTRAVGTIGGAVIGALLGGAVAGRGDRTTGAVVGGVGGAVVGNQLSRSRASCARAYGYVDNNGYWHASDVGRAEATGYYNRDGDWIDGAPAGFYNTQNHWVATDASTSTGGYYDNDGRWVSATSDGYNDGDNRWVSGAVSGYYDRNGRWISGSAIGRYDNNGRWMSGQASGHRDARGGWVPDPQTGYYENGRWRAGTVTGYYDSRGRWIATTPVGLTGYEQDLERGEQGIWRGAPRDFHGRADWLDQRIRSGLERRRLGRDDGVRGLRSLNEIRREESGMRHTRGRLNRRDEQFVLSKLDFLADSLEWDHQRRR